MKVYSTEQRCEDVVLTEYPSIAEFEKNNSWCDERFINVASTRDLYLYEFAHEQGMVVYNDIQKKSQLLLQGIFLNGN